MYEEVRQRQTTGGILGRVVDQPSLAGRQGASRGQGFGVGPAGAEALPDPRLQGPASGWAQVLVHVLAFDDQGRILLGRVPAAGDTGARILWGLPYTPAVAGRDPDVSARTLAPARSRPGTAPPARPVPLGARSALSAVPPVHVIHLLYAVHVPVPPAAPRPDGAAWWGLAEAAQLELSELTRLALALGWPLLPGG